MFTREIHFPENQSFFLFGPRGTGKSTLLRRRYPDAQFVDLLNPALQRQLSARPEQLLEMVPESNNNLIVIDEVQKVPALLDVVHSRIAGHRQRFCLTGSSARSLRRQGVNLLAGRARTEYLHPLTASEIGSTFDLQQALQSGMLPDAYQSATPAAFLDAYVHTYLREEVQEEGLTRHMGTFSRFLEAAAYSQGATLNISAVARDTEAKRGIVQGYFEILEDLLLATRIPSFKKNASRRVVDHPKFYYFDAGVFRALAPRGPLAPHINYDGVALETLVFQHLRAYSDYHPDKYQLYYWRTRSGLEVDFVLYGEHKLIAVETKLSRTIRKQDLRGLQHFAEDYPMAECYVVYGGAEERQFGNIKAIPVEQALKTMADWL